MIFTRRNPPVFHTVPHNEVIRISVNEEEGINNNAQLAYIRAHSMKNFLENNISVLRNTDNHYEFITKCLP